MSRAAFVDAVRAWTRLGDAYRSLSDARDCDVLTDAEVDALATAVRMVDWIEQRIYNDHIKAGVES